MIARHIKFREQRELIRDSLDEDDIVLFHTSIEGEICTVGASLHEYNNSLYENYLFHDVAGDPIQEDGWVGQYLKYRT